MPARNSEAKKAYNRAYNRALIEGLRRQVHRALGNRCKCGYGDFRAIQIDHFHGGGTRERLEYRNNRAAFYRRVLLSIMAGEDKYQLLCANCNWIKRWENGENGSRSGDLAQPHPSG